MRLSSLAVQAIDFAFATNTICLLYIVQVQNNYDSNVDASFPCLHAIQLYLTQYILKDGDDETQ